MRKTSPRKKHIVYTGFALLSLIIILSPFIASLIYIPYEMRIIAGKEHNFKFHLPLQANISSEKQGVLKVNHEPIDSDNFHISLNKPFSIESEEMGTLDVELKLFGLIPLKTVKVDVIPDMKVIPCGMTVGVKIATDGVMVLGTGSVNGSDGRVYEPSKGILRTGDLILEVNGKAIQTTKELTEYITQSDQKTVDMKIKREEQIIKASVQPIKSLEENSYKLGIWVRDSTQGIGTITYFNPETMHYGALGHGITDVDTRQLMSVRNGKIMEAEITSIKRGEKGFPGELSGAILESDETTLGNVEANTEQGIFGKVDSDSINFFANTSLPIALQHEVEEGPAVIRSNISGQRIEEFSIYIEKVARYTDHTSKGMIIRIIDQRLLDKTNGIVQGMSGSPIIQNGKLIGAVTHVFVQDPSKGYGIFIENMLKREKQLDNNGKMVAN